MRGRSPRLTAFSASAERPVAAAGEMVGDRLLGDAELARRAPPGSAARRARRSAGEDLRLPGVQLREISSARAKTARTQRRSPSRRLLPGDRRSAGRAPCCRARARKLERRAGGDLEVGGLGQRSRPDADRDPGVEGAAERARGVPAGSGRRAARTAAGRRGTASRRRGSRAEARRAAAAVQGRRSPASDRRRRARASPPRARSGASLDEPTRSPVKTDDLGANSLPGLRLGCGIVRSCLRRPTMAVRAASAASVT